MTCRHGDWEKNKPANRLVFGGAGCVADTPVVCQKNESDCYNDGFPVVYVSSLNWSVSTYAEGNSWFFDWVFPLQTEGQKEMSKQKAPRSPSWQVASILAVAVLAAGSVAVGVPVAEAQEGVEKCKYLVAHIVRVRGPPYMNCSSLVGLRNQLPISGERVTLSFAASFLWPT